MFRRGHDEQTYGRNLDEAECREVPSAFDESAARGAILAPFDELPVKTQHQCQAYHAKLGKKVQIRVVRVGIAVFDDDVGRYAEHAEIRHDVAYLVVE